MQLHNQILQTAASGDVEALRSVARETGPVLIAAVQNKVCVVAYMEHMIVTKTVQTCILCQ